MRGRGGGEAGEGRGEAVHLFLNKERSLGPASPGLAGGHTVCWPGAERGAIHVAA